MPNDKDYWYDYKVTPSLHICQAYNDMVFARNRKNKIASPSGGEDGSAFEGRRSAGDQSI